MAVSRVANVTNVNGSAASTSVSWFSPISAGNIVANDVWILAGTFRAGSGVTISGVPASFNLIQRVDQGAGATVDTIVAYWYLATGSEPSGASIGAITISASSKYLAFTQAYRGTDLTTPVSGSVVTGTGTTTATSGTLATTPSGGAAVVWSACQAASAAPAVTGGTSNPTSEGGTFTTGGSGATNVAGALYDALSSEFTTSQTYTGTQAGASTSAIMAFILAAPAAAGIPDVTVARIRT